MAVKAAFTGVAFSDLFAALPDKSRTFMSGQVMRSLRFYVVNPDELFLMSSLEIILIQRKFHRIIRLHHPSDRENAV